MKKHTIIITMAALVSVLGLAASCVAASPHGEIVNPTQFMYLLDEPGAAPVESGQSFTNQPPAEAPVTVAGSQVQRLLEESELILRGIAAEAGPAREELQNASMRALDVIRSYIDRLPPKPSISPAVAEPAASATNASAAAVPQVVAPSSPAEVSAEPSEIRPNAATAVTPREPEAPGPHPDAAQSTPYEALRELVAKLREVAAAAESRAAELERLSEALEGPRNE